MWYSRYSRISEKHVAPKMVEHILLLLTKFFFIVNNYLIEFNANVIKVSGPHPRKNPSGTHTVGTFLIIIQKRRSVTAYLHLHCTSDFPFFCLASSPSTPPPHTFSLGCQCLCMHHHLYNPNHTNIKTEQNQHNNFISTVRFLQVVCIVFSLQYKLGTISSDPYQ
jgi:hypothetical protein